MIAIPGISFGQSVDLTSFEDDLEEGGGIPYCQVVNPRVGLTTNEIKKNPDYYGLIVPKEQAEQVGFTPGKKWKELTVTIVAGDDEIEIDCYQTHEPTFLVISRSQLEVQEATEQGWRYIGIGYNKGKKTQFAEMVEADTSNPPMFRYAVRYLLVFLDEDGTPLQSQPLALTGRGGFGGSFGKEVSSYFQEFDQAYCRATKKRGRLSDYAQAFVIHSHAIGFHKGKDTMAYTCIDARLLPVADASKSGEEKEIERRDRKVKVTAAPVTALMFPKESETGKQISNWFSEYQDFAKPNRGMDDEQSVAPVVFQAVGVIESPQFLDNGNVKAMLVYSDDDGSKQQAIIIPPSLAGCLDVAGDYLIKGIKQGGAVVVELAELSSGDAVATESYDEIPY